jgi:HAD superfamily hydrolase (TIGR01509 family)
VTLKALLFDFDGLIADTEMPVYLSWQALYREYEVELPFKDWLRCIGADFGPDTFDPVATLEAELGRTLDWETVGPRRRAIEMHLIERILPLPGVEELIDTARAAGIKLAVASSSPHAWVDGHLRRLGLFERFDAVICEEDVEKIKPAPDLFLKAAATLGVAPAEAVVLEDSPHGLAAAASAGMFSVAVPNELTRHLDTSQANLRVATLGDLSLERLQAAMTANHR